MAEFIRNKGITRCPTVCLAPTHGSVAIADRVALQQRAEQLEMLREEKMGRANAAFMAQPSGALFHPSARSLFGNLIGRMNAKR